MKKKVIIGIVIIMVILGSIILVYSKNLKKEKTVKNDTEEITNMKDELGIQGDTRLYETDTEYDGRKVLAIKPDIQYNVIMAGILNQNKPELKEVDKIVEQDSPKNSGIWISKNARRKFLEILKLITECEYIINEQGYLEQQERENLNQYDKKLKEILANGKQYNIEIDSKYYLIDMVTGEIIEEPFELMDPRTPYEYFELENKSIYIITTNSKEKLSNQEILKEILESMK